MQKRLGKRYSIFGRLTLIMAAGAIFVNIIVFTGVNVIQRRANSRREIVDLILQRYLDQLGMEFSSSAQDEEALKKIATREDIPIAAMKDSLILKSNPELTTLHQEMMDHRDKDLDDNDYERGSSVVHIRDEDETPYAKSPQHVHTKHGPIFFSRQGPWLIAFAPFGHLNPRGIPWYEIALTLSATTLISILAYWLIRRMLDPIHILHSGVKSVAAGSLDVQIEIPNRDELGNLADAFNHMCRKISRLLEDKERLIVDVSHDLRSPLARIRLAAHMVDNKTYGSAIEKEVELLDRLIGMILERSRVTQSAILTEISPKELAESIFHDMSLEFPGVSWQIAELSPRQTIAAHVDQMTVVTRNLLDNAIKHSGPNARPPEVHMSVTDEHKFEIKVIDFGVGIAPEHLVQVKKPFFRVDSARNPNHSGYGLGLNICDRIVQNHHGEFAITSTLGKGSQFTISLPVAS